MKEIEVEPCNVVVSDMGGYQHWSLVSDQVCKLGKPMLISATERNGTVMEEPWDVVVGSRKFVVVAFDSERTREDILLAARTNINEWDYSVTLRNCEHFVRMVLGQRVTSSQVTAAITGALAGAAGVAVVSKRPNAVSLGIGALVTAAVAVYLVRQTEES